MAPVEDHLLFHCKDFADGHFRVVSFHGAERANTPYRVSVRLLAPLHSDTVDNLEATMLGRGASLEVRHTTGPSRNFHGVVEGFSLLEVHKAERVLIEVDIVPHFALLALRTHSRIFQEKTVIDVVTTVLDEWQVKHRFQLSRSYVAWPYSTQHNETDRAFLERILADEGIFYYFVQGDDEEELVFQDLPNYESAAPGGLLTLRFDARSGLVAPDRVSGFSMRRVLKPKATLLGDFDFRRPDHPQRGSYRDDPTPIGPKTKLSPDLYQAYTYQDRGEPEQPGVTDSADERARVVLEQHRRERYVASGTTASAFPLPGHALRVEEHPLDRLNRPYVVLSASHRAATGVDDSGEAETYECTFEALPAEIALRPDAPRGRCVQTAETATVVGPKGEEIYTDEEGRIKVQFHWDLEGQRDEKSSCWIRVAQPWAGARHGFVLLPRVGMEVLVTFIGGDPDRPLVSGCVYNATHPVPFELPEERTRSGIRTQSSPGGDGFNELSFSDRAGDEEIYLHAQKDLREEIKNDHDMKVEGSETIVVNEGRSLTVGGPSASVIGGGLTQTVALDRSVSVLGSTTETVSGNADVRVAQNRTTTVEGEDRLNVMSAAHAAIEEDLTLRVAGHLITIVGEHDARTSATLHVEGGTQLHSTGKTEIRSDKSITFRCGESLLHMTEDEISLSAPRISLRGDELLQKAEKAARVDAETWTIALTKDALIKSDKKIVLKGEEGQVQLDKNARIDGKLIKLNCAPDPVDDEAPEEEEPLEPTTISLVDQDGKPMKGQRFILVLKDGTEVGGKLNEEGKAEVYVDQDGDVIFPDVDKSRPK